MSKDDGSGGFLIGLLIGGIIGSAIVFLYAPSSGKKLRRKIAGEAKDVLEEVEEIYDTGKAKAQRFLKEGKEKASEIMQDAKKKIVKN